jgi:hypothetical protein
MAFEDTEKNAMLDATGATHASLLTGLPPGNEVSPITRQTIGFAAAAGGSKAMSGGPLTFAVPAATEVFFVGLFDALTVGNLLSYHPINGGDVDGVGYGEADDNTIYAPDHGLAGGDRVILKAPAGNALPVGLNTTTIYHVVAAPGTDSFQVETSAGGGAAAITDDGQVYFQKIVPETFGGAGSLDIDSLSLKLEE